MQHAFDLSPEWTKIPLYSNFLGETSERNFPLPKRGVRQVATVKLHRILVYTNTLGQLVKRGRVQLSKQVWITENQTDICVAYTKGLLSFGLKRAISH